MVHSFLFHAKSTSPHHSLFFPHCIICSTQYLHLISLMPFWKNTVLLTLPWSTHKEHMPHPNTPRDWHFKRNPSSPCLWPIAATLHLWHKVYWSPTIIPGTPNYLFLMHTHFFHTSSPWWSHPDSPWLTSSHMAHWVILSHFSDSIPWLIPSHIKSHGSSRSHLRSTWLMLSHSSESSLWFILTHVSDSYWVKSSHIWVILD